MNMNKLLIFCFAFLASLAIVYAVDLPNHVVVSELGINPSYNGDFLETGKEYIELYNPTSSGVAIGNWRIRFRGLPSSDDVIILPGSMIPANGYYLIGDVGGWPSTWNKPDLFYEFRLENENYGLNLVDGSSNVIDTVGWGNLVFYPSFFEGETLPNANLDGHSYERKPGFNCGNWKDTNNNSNDFFDNSDLNPQNSSFIEAPCDIVVECVSDSDCDDGNYCNGAERCIGDSCVGGTNVDCDDGVVCTIDSCNENTDSCDNLQEDLLCDDGAYCNGAEFCDAVLDCQSASAVDCSANNIPGIASCFNNPDNIDFTYDYRASFTSTCDEVNNQCTTENGAITSTCDIAQCGAECDSADDCGQGFECGLTCNCVLSGEPYCGDGIKNNNEECDANDFGGLDCTDFSFGNGTLNCNGCVINTDNCFSVDADNDGVIDSEDNCINNDNTDQSDADGDGAGDVCDTCPNDADNDIDQDGVCGNLDNCVSIANPNQEDTDEDGIGDICDVDTDGDDIIDSEDNCVGVANPNQENSDNDSAGDLCDICPNDAYNDIEGDDVCGDLDNCPDDANAGQEDNDQDGEGDVCDNDADNDGIDDRLDACPLDSENDIDQDTICGNIDNCPEAANAGQEDNDGDDTGDSCDEDDDNDSVFDSADYCPLDANNDADEDEVCANIDNCPDAYNELQEDSELQEDYDNDNLGSVCDTCPNDSENDIDDDEVCGDIDYIVGSSSSIKTNVDCLSFSVNDGTDVPSFDGIGDVAIKECNEIMPVVEFNFSFGNGNVLNLLDVNITVSSNSIIINGINASNITKTVYMNRGLGTDTLCIIDAEVSSITVQGDCSNGIKLTCDGNSSGYTCEIIENDTLYKISGLKHSAVAEYSYSPPSDGGSTGTPSSTSSTGSPITTTCTPDWQCTEWSACGSNSKSTRSCNDANNCGQEKPSEERNCYYVAPEGETPKTAVQQETNEISGEEETVEPIEEEIVVDEGNRITGAVVGWVSDAYGTVKENLSAAAGVLFIVILLIALSVYLNKKGNKKGRKRKRKTSKLLLVYILLLTSFVSLAYAADHIVISEALYNPVGPENKEWVELYNPTNSIVDIAGWKIYSYSTSAPDIVIPAGKSIQPNGFFLIGDEQLDSSLPAADYQEELYLTNFHSGIQLKNSANDVIDTLGWGDSNQITTSYYEGEAHGTVAEGHSLQRILDNGCNVQDTDNNLADFIDKSTPNPRNSSYICEPAICSDGIISGDEVCDGSNLDGKTCQDFGYANPNTLACGNDCLSFDTSGCSAVCGDGNTEPGENCDDGNLLNGDGCSSICVNEGAPVCGDNVIGNGEVCDNNNLNGKTCQDFGYTNPNTLTCNNNCLNFNLSMCTSVCGNSHVEPGEQCDDGNLINGDGCSSICVNEGTPVCGDNIIDWHEDCDNANLDGKTCQDFGYINPNTLACSNDCLSFNTSGCNAVCGNGNTEPGEDCDDGNLLNEDGCSSICQSEIVDDLQVNYIRGKMTLDGVVAPEGVSYKLKVMSGDNVGKIYEGVIDDDNIPSFLNGNGFFDTRDQIVFTTGSTFKIMSESCEGSFEGQFLNGGNGDFLGETVNFDCIIPPLINDVYISPTEPTELDNVNIFANVTDNFGVDTVAINYTLNGGDINSHSMDFGVVYSIDLGLFSKGDVIEYKIIAKDTYGNYAISDVYTITVKAGDKDNDGYDSNVDCNEDDALINPGENETCNGIDDNCNIEIDEQNAQGCTVYYKDVDNDGYGLTDDNKCLCSAQEPYNVTESNDCNDADVGINPAAIDVCNEVNDDCDSETEDGSGETAPDNSNQEGVCAASVQSCLGGIWTDNYSLIPDHEDIESSCDGKDNDCDANVDEDVKTIYYEDLDSDTYGNAGISQEVCTQPDGYVDDNTDCDDTEVDVNPAAIDVCNGINDDCDSETEDGSGEAAPDNSKQDGLCASSVQSCIGGSWEDDYSSIVDYEDTETSCDGLDNNCDSVVDESFEDTDTDGDKDCVDEDDDGDGVLDNEDGYPLDPERSILGDINGDDRVDILDLIAARNAMGSHPGDSNWNSWADVNNDGVVNILDLVKIRNSLV